MANTTPKLLPQLDKCKPHLYGECYRKYHSNLALKDGWGYLNLSLTSWSLESNWNTVLVSCISKERSNLNELD